MLGLACVLLLMPASYRAGTETPHPHAFFQGIVEVITGQAHEHDGVPEATATQTRDSTSNSASILSPFSGANIPLSASAAVDDAPPSVKINADTGAPLDATPFRERIDSLQVTDLKPAIDQGTAIAAIGLLIALWFASDQLRRLWFATTRLTANDPHGETPPPRISCLI
jgi:hypothetical protein